MSRTTQGRYQLFTVDGRHYRGDVHDHQELHRLPALHDYQGNPLSAIQSLVLAVVTDEPETVRQIATRARLGRRVTLDVLQILRRKQLVHTPARGRWCLL